MYERFYHLRERPFALSPDPDYLYPSRVHTEALDYLRYGIESHAGFVVITGEIGSGKTTLLQTLLRGLDSQTTVGAASSTRCSTARADRGGHARLRPGPGRASSKPHAAARSGAGSSSISGWPGGWCCWSSTKRRTSSLAALEEAPDALEPGDREVEADADRAGRPAEPARRARARPSSSSCGSGSPSAITCRRSTRTRPAHYINHRLRRAALGAPLVFPRDVDRSDRTRAASGVPRHDQRHLPTPRWCSATARSGASIDARAGARSDRRAARRPGCCRRRRASRDRAGRSAGGRGPPATASAATAGAPSRRAIAAAAGRDEALARERARPSTAARDSRSSSANRRRVARSRSWPNSAASSPSSTGCCGAAGRRAARRTRRRAACRARSAPPRRSRPSAPSARSDRAGALSTADARAEGFWQPAQTTYARCFLLHRSDVDVSDQWTCCVETIRSRRARAGVVGLGYVGLPLAVEFAQGGLSCHRHRPRRPQGRRRSHDGRSYIPDVADRRRPARCVAKGLLDATTDFSVVAELDTINICVPTPLRKTKDPDMSYIVSAVEAIADAPAPGHAGRPRVDDLSGHDRRGGAADARGERAEGRRRLLPRLLARARRSGQPARSTPTTCRRWSAASRPTCAELARRALRHGDRNDRPGQLAARRRDGEAAREHVPRGEHRPGQRDRADVRQAWHRRLGSGRRGARPSRSASCRSIPGPGLGGHCIPIDPFYLSWKAKQTGFDPRFIELAGHINAAMPHYVVDKIGEALNARRKVDQRLAAS